ncbi:glycosyl transferase [Frigidibacter sp. MR17.14]|uniref:glycosyl transferase n=1 Tax=Frigidibacter sp. MR17.14 TaxID=3126509 RepID=UPI003012EF6B
MGTVPQHSDDVLQSVLLPQPGLCTEPELYYHVEGTVSLDMTNRLLRLDRHAIVRFDSYFNMFSLSKWRANGRLDSLALHVVASGRFELRVLRASPGASWEIVASGVHVVRPGALLQVPLDDLTAPTGSVLWFEIKALDAVVFSDAAFVAAPVEAARQPRIALCITTFRREEEARATALRLDRFLAEQDLGGRMHVFIVDNGDTLDLPPLVHVERLGNPNLGGAGGFARGLAAARAGGYTHCLFMDDDAAVPLEAIRRADALLSRAADPRRAVAGAMISTRHRWALWEAGARFDLRCHPEQGGRDLRRRDEVIALESATAATPPGFYAGFWFFVFPLAGLTADPFPFFVRGDDVSFSLANDFAPVRLNGIVAFQDDFIEKESPTTHYLDLRSHLAHHFSLAELARGRLALIAMVLGFLCRSLARFHYDTAEAELLAWQDALSGPEGFAKAPGLEARRQTLQGITRSERRRSMPMQVPRRLRLRAAAFRWLLWLTLNGHGLPLSRLWAGRAAIHAEERGTVARVLGTDRYSVSFRADGTGYVLHKDTRRALNIIGRAMRLALRHWRRQPSLRAAYGAAYPVLTSPEYWKQWFHPDEQLSGKTPDEDYQGDQRCPVVQADAA